MNLRRTLVATLIGTTAAIAAVASDIENQDQRDYELKIRTSPGATSNRTLYHGSKAAGICSSPCEIEVVGIGTVKLDGKNSAVIKGGRIFVVK